MKPSKSALFDAAKRWDAAAVAALLKAASALVSATVLRAHGETPIFYAARTQRLKTLDLLIKAGADPAIKDDRRRDAVEIANARRLPKDVIARLERLRPS